MGTINTNEWRGNVSVQFMTDDIKIDGLQVIDQRTSNLNKNLFKSDMQYVFFNQKLMDLIQSQNLNRKFYYYSSSAIEKNDTIVLVDCPDNLAEMAELIKATQPQRIITYFFHNVDFYASGMPSRIEFKQMFGIVKTQKLTKTDIMQLGPKLKIDQEKINFMIKVFFELNFVKIENGLLFINAEAEQHQLTEAPAYKKREELIQTQEKLLYSSGDELSAIVEKLMNVDNKGVS